jgi:hypothetical protein
MKQFTLTLIGLAMLGLVACSGGGGGSAVTAGGSGQTIPPAQIRTQEYPNVKGQIFGSWATTDEIQGADRQLIQLNISAYVAANKTAFKLECLKNGEILGDYAAIVGSSVTASTITFTSSVKLAAGTGCEWSTPQGSLAYTMISYRFNDKVSVVDGAKTYIFDRTGDGDPTSTPGPSSGATMFALGSCIGDSKKDFVPGQCSALHGFMVKSVRINGQCSDFSQALDGAQVCGANLH